MSLLVFRRGLRDLYLRWQQISNSDDPDVGTWNRVILNKVTAEFVSKSVTGNQAGRIRTLHERDRGFNAFVHSLENNSDIYKIFPPPGAVD